MNDQVMTRRRPGDYVINAELTPDQIRLFVAHCENRGCRNRGDHFHWPVTTWNLNTLDSRIVKQVENAVEGVAEEYLHNDNARNVTSEYKEQQILADNGPDLPTVLEECAEHLRAGCDPRDYFEVHAGGWVRGAPMDIMELLKFAEKGQILRKPACKTPIEDDVGRLVMVRDSDAQHWRGPYVLKEVSAAGYRISQNIPHGQAKLYQGPTRPNWIEHDGRGVPEDVHKAGGALVQDRDGGIRYIGVFHSSWSIKEGVGTIIRYTIIEP